LPRELDIAPRALIFDLDGTLIDSAPIVGAILDAMREELGKPALDPEFYRQWSSRGGAALVGRALDIDPAEAEEAVAEFRARYARVVAVEDDLFPGVRATLQNLAGSGFPLGLCTNKPAVLTQKILRDLELDRFFAVVIASESGRKTKPHPEPLERALAGLAASPERALFVGDSSVDQQTAQAAGVPFAFFGPGYDDGVDRAAADYQLANISDLLALV